MPATPGRGPLGVLTVAAIAVVVLAGIGLRFWTRSPLWLDEALTVNIARAPIGSIMGALRHDGHPPLYYWLLNVWMEAAGDGDGAVRALSGLFAVAALPLAWVAGRRLGGKAAGAAALVLLALSPFALRYGTEARMYAAVMFLVLVGHLTLRATLDETRPGRLVGLGAVTGALLLTHYWSIYLVAATAIVLVLGVWRSPPRRSASLWALAAMAGGSLLFAPWLPSFVSQARHTGTPWAPPARPTVALATMLEDFGGTKSEGHLLGIVLVICVLLALFVRPRAEGPGLDLDTRTVPGARAEATVAGLTLLLGTTVSVVTRSAFATRYASVVFPLVVLVAAVGVSRLRRVREQAVVLAVAVLLGGVGAVRNVTTDRTQAGDVVRALNAGAQTGDVVVYCPDQLGPAFSRHLKAGLTLLAYPTLAAPYVVDWRDYEERNAASDPTPIAHEVLARTPTDRTVWLVWASGYRTFGTQCEALSAELGRSRPVDLPVVSDGGDDFFEHAWLFRFGPAAG